MDFDKFIELFILLQEGRISANYTRFSLCVSLFSRFLLRNNFASTHRVCNNSPSPPRPPPESNNLYQKAGKFRAEGKHHKSPQRHFLCHFLMSHILATLNFILKIPPPKQATIQLKHKQITRGSLRFKQNGSQPEKSLSCCMQNTGMGLLKTYRQLSAITPPTGAQRGPPSMLNCPEKKVSLANPCY